MPFSVSWHTLLDELDDLPEGSTLITPLSHDRFRVTGVQEQRVIVEFLDRDIDETRPLQRDQFETLYRRITDEPGGFDLDRLSPDADPYLAVLSLHPRFEVDEDAGVITKTEEPTTSQLLDTEAEPDTEERTEPDLDVYADALLLVEAFVPVAVEKADGFAGFRETATKTNSLVDRLEAITLPDPDDVADDLERYREAVERAEELDEKIQRTDDLIDDIVYDLYGLTDEEIEIVEEAVNAD